VPYIKAMTDKKERGVTNPLSFILIFYLLSCSQQPLTRRSSKLLATLLWMLRRCVIEPLVQNKDSALSFSQRPGRI
jgi:hypothetical protein